jgi:hypothetical protein
MKTAKTKSEIRFDHKLKRFILNGKRISEAQAHERWDACDSDWTQGAYLEMALRVMIQRH